MTGYTEVQALGDITQWLQSIEQTISDVVHEQHTANLIALLASEGAWSRIGRERADAITAQIVSRLGLDS